MGQVLHGGARTTEAVRRAIQASQESLRALAKRYGVNQKTIAKWKRRTSVSDERTGPKDPHSTVLSLEDEAIVVAFRKHTLLPLDDAATTVCVRAERAMNARLGGSCSVPVAGHAELSQGVLTVRGLVEILGAEDEHNVVVEGLADSGLCRLVHRLRKVDAPDLRADHGMHLDDFHAFLRK